MEFLTECGYARKKTPGALRSIGGAGFRRPAGPGPLVRAGGGQVAQSSTRDGRSSFP